MGHFWVQKPSLSKWGQVRNLSYENEFYLHENEKSFPYQRLSTWPRFETEAWRNSEMAYCGTITLFTWSVLLLNIDSSRPISAVEIAQLL